MSEAFLCVAEKKFSIFGSLINPEWNPEGYTVALTPPVFSALENVC